MSFHFLFGLLRPVVCAFICLARLFIYIFTALCLLHQFYFACLIQNTFVCFSFLFILRFLLLLCINAVYSFTFYPFFLLVSTFTDFFFIFMYFILSIFLTLDFAFPRVVFSKGNLGPVQTSNFTCAEPNTNLGRPK